MFSSIGLDRAFRLAIVIVGAVALVGSACAPRPTESATTSTPIKIGFVWGITGATAEIVRPMSAAARAYFDDLNKHGGIHGHPVQMVEIDSKYQVPLAQEGYKKVTTEDTVPLLVLASTGDTEALAPQINADKIPTVTFSCDEKWAKPDLNPYVFTVCTTYQDQMRAALSFVKQRERASGAAPRIAFSYPDNPFGQSPLAVGKAYAQSLGLPLVGEAKVGTADVDAQSQALALKTADPNYVIVQNVTGGASAIVRSAKQVGLQSQFLGLNYAFDEATIQAIGAQAAEGYLGVGPNAFPGPEVGAVKDIAERAPGLLRALEQTDLDVKGAIPGSRWVYTSQSHVPTRKSVFYQVSNGRIEKVSDPIDPPER